MKQLFFALLVANSEAWAPQNRLASWIPHGEISVGSSSSSSSYSRSRCSPVFSSNQGDDEEEEWSDFVDLGFSGTSSTSSNNNNNNESGKRNFMGNDDKVDDDKNDSDQRQPDFAKLLQERTGAIDWTAIQTRQFSLGQDLILTDYVGNMGFDEVTDWEYYYPSEEDEDERQVVQPNPFDSSK
jgi:hypothetical protein